MKPKAFYPCRGQSVIEYTMLVGIISVVLFYMGTNIKRGVQSLVKVTADQVGNQQNSDQNFNDAQSGYMESSNSSSHTINNRQVAEIGYIASSGNAVYIANTTYNNYTDTETTAVTNGGFSPSTGQ